MKKKFIVVGGLLAATGGAAVLALYFYFLRPVESRAPTAKELDAHAARYGIVLPPSAPAPVKAAPPIDPKKPVRLAIGWLGLPDQAQNEQVADLMLAELSSSRNLQFVDRQSLDKVLRESEMSLSGLIRAGTATRLGKLLRADWFLLGSPAAVNGSNYLVVRLVDARTGVMFNADLFSRQEGVSPLVSKLSVFVRQSRGSASHPGQQHTFLAIGGLKDVSINNRQAEFPVKLRGYLTAAFQGNKSVTLLEREFVDVLQQELRLDLAGLTEENAATAPQPMQAAFWLVDGYYQSYESAGYEVEAVLQIHRMFGRSAMETFRGPSEEPLYRQIKEKIESTMTKTDAGLLMPTRRSEIQAQLDQGEQLSEMFAAAPGSSQRGKRYFLRTERDVIRATQNLEEAVRAYQTVLVLDPENHQAKMRLASCLQHPLLGRESEARNYVREVAESSINDNWNLPAMLALGNYYRYEDPAQAAGWFRRASEYSKTHPSPPGSGPWLGSGSVIWRTNEPAEYLQLAEAIIAEMQATTNTPQFNLETKLVDGTKEMQKWYESPGFAGDSGTGYGIESFVRDFGPDRVAAVSRLNELLPGLLEKFPKLAPHLLAIAVTYQSDTNSPVVARFVESFEKCTENPAAIEAKPVYFWRVSRQCYSWSMENKMYALAARIVEAKMRVEMKQGGIDSDFGFVEVGMVTGAAVLPEPAAAIIMREDKTKLVYAYMKLERWRDALNILEELPRQPYSAPGGVQPDGTVIPAELANQCRKMLGLPVEEDPRVFSLGEPWLTVQGPLGLASDQDSLLILTGSKLWKMDFESKSRTEIVLPKRSNSAINAVRSVKSKLWIGTMGDGLIEYDKQTHECRQFTEKDGLLINDVLALCSQDDVMWLGFGGASVEGGFGRLDLRTGRATAFTQSLRSRTAEFTSSIQYGSHENNEPPREPVVWIGAGRTNELLVMGASHALRLFHIKDGTWETLQWGPVRLATDSRRLVLALSNDPGGTGVLVQNFADGQVEKLGLSAGLPSTQVTTVALDGDDLWVGGAGFIGVMDINKQVLRKLCYVHSASVDHFEFAGGYVWVRIGQNLYRIPLSETR